jgi:hypothetical protein
VLNRCLDPASSERWSLALPESRPAARTALAGWRPPGRLGYALRSLADLVERSR